MKKSQSESRPKRHLQDIGEKYRPNIYKAEKSIPAVQQAVSLTDPLSNVHVQLTRSVLLRLTWNLQLEID